MSIQATNNVLPAIGQAGQIHAPMEHAAQFRALLKNVEKSMGSSSTSLQSRTDEKKWQSVSMIEDTALRVDQSQQAISRLEKNIRQTTFELKNSLEMDSSFSRNIVQQKFATAYYFVGIARVESSASNFSEELTSVTKGR